MYKLQKWSHILLKSAWRRMRSLIKGSRTYIVQCKCFFAFIFTNKNCGKIQNQISKRCTNCKKWSHILLKSAWKRMRSLIKGSRTYIVQCKCLFAFMFTKKNVGKFKIKFLKGVKTTKVKSHFVTICMKKNALCHKRKHFVYSST